MPEDGFSLLEFLTGMIDATVDHLMELSKLNGNNTYTMTIGIEVRLPPLTPPSSTASPRTQRSRRPLTRPVPSATDSFKNAFDPSVIEEENRAREES
jgi:hypothetical protein